ncbi:MAG: RluA family pseudouridine synthase [Lachnospiraceae bacterium]|nr:RluA family pseudouridine synthase [Lachnospiraceae bacterium]
MKTFEIGKNEAGQRLDKYLSKLLREAPKSFIYKMLRKKNITLNGAKASGSEKLKEGDEIRLFLSDETFGKFQGSPREDTNSRQKEQGGSNAAADGKAFSSGIIYEDDDLLFWNKPQGILSQPDNSGLASVVTMLEEYLLLEGKLGALDLATFHPAPMNRLDRNTSGIVLCGKSLKGLQFLSEAIREREMDKTYICVTDGRPPEGVHTAWLKKDAKKNTVHVTASQAPGSRMIQTGFRIRKSVGRYAVTEAKLITGRPHQIRAHLAFLGSCILGDPKYGNPDVNREAREKYGIQYQMLHAESVSFPAISGDFGYLSGRTFTAAAPDSFAYFI